MDTMERTATGVASATPTVRVRIAHTRTIKDGWGYESSVEVTMPGADADHPETELLLQETLERLLTIARAHGERERDVRNQREGRA